METAMQTAAAVPVKSTVVVNVPIPKAMSGHIIGKGGEALKIMCAQSSARIVVKPEETPEGLRFVRMTGTFEQVAAAQQLLQVKLAEAAMQGVCMDLGNNWIENLPVHLQVSHHAVGRIVGKAGAHLKELQANFGVKIKVDRTVFVENGQELRDVEVIGPYMSSIATQHMILQVEAGALATNQEINATVVGTKRKSAEEGGQPADLMQTPNMRPANQRSRGQEAALWVAHLLGHRAPLG